MGIFLLIVGIVLFIGLVVVHEWGHFMAARRGGVDIEEFGIFFPPRLYKKRMKGGWDFTVNALPLGGFVKLKGEHDSDTEKGSFGAATTWVKTKIMLAGVAMNLVVALVLFTLLALLGMPKILDNQFTVASDTKIVHQTVFVGYIEPGSPADKAGLQTKDQLVAVGQGAHMQKVANSAALPKITKQYAGKQVTVEYVRGGKTVEAQTTLRPSAVVEASKKTDTPKGYLGIEPVSYTLQRSTWSAPVVAVGLSAQLTGLTFQGLGHALAGLGGIIAGAFTGNHVARENAQTAASSQVSGIVGIFFVLKDGSFMGLQFMLLIIAVISLTLAIMNVLPIPALDGGRLFLMWTSRIINKPISAKLEENINAIGFITLILLMVLITIVDVKRFF